MVCMIVIIVIITGFKNMLAAWGLQKTARFLSGAHEKRMIFFISWVPDFTQNN